MNAEQRDNAERDCLKEELRRLQLVVVRYRAALFALETDPCVETQDAYRQRQADVVNAARFAIQAEPELEEASH
jgi:hypothetical protein